MKNILILAAALAMTGCSTYMPQRYSIAADNNVALKALGRGNINIGNFTRVGAFD